jgi:Tfp pilus assembly protein PilO
MALDYKSSLSRYRRYLQLVRERPMWSASLWVILSLILLIVLLVMALKPTLVTISGLLGQIKQQKEVSVELDKRIVEVQKAIAELNSIKDERPVLDKALPQVPDWENLANELSSLATDSGLMTTDLVINKVPLLPTESFTSSGGEIINQLPKGVIPVSFTLTMTGEYTQMRQVVTEIQSMNRVIMITSVDISIDKKGMQVMTLNGEAGYIPDQLL